MTWTIGLCLAGILLGVSWNALILVPVTGGLLILFGVGALADGDLYQTLGSIVLRVVALQAGYMLGLTNREAVRQYVEKRSTAGTERV